jgi:putative endonuclease
MGTRTKYSFRRFLKTPSSSLVRTQAFQACSAGSNPAGVAKTMFYVYILKSLKDEKHYIGYTKDLQQRIEEHNRGKSPSVKSRAPFVLIYQEAHPSRLQAIRREKQIKAYKGGNAFIKLIQGEKKSLDPRSSAPPWAGLGSLSIPAPQPSRRIIC